MENNPTPPDNTLYQYRPPEQRVFDGLRDGLVYFGAPRNFNDPHDFQRLRLKISDEGVGNLLKTGGIDASPQNKMQALRKVLAGVLGAQDMTEEQLRVHLNGIGMRVPQGDTCTAVKKVLMRQFDSVFTDLFIDGRNMLGVSCFSEHKDNALMWSRYAGDDKGFCLEFDAHTLQDSLHEKSLKSSDGAIRFRRVAYPLTTPESDPLTWEAGKRDEKYEEFLSQKSPYWSYEKEWRGFRKYTGAAPYDKAALRCVYLGATADERTKELVYAIVTREYRHANVFEAKRSNRKPAVVNFKRYRPTARHAFAWSHRSGGNN